MIHLRDGTGDSVDPADPEGVRIDHRLRRRLERCCVGGAGGWAARMLWSAVGVMPAREGDFRVLVDRFSDSALERGGVLGGPGPEVECGTAQEPLHRVGGGARLPGVGGE